MPRALENLNVKRVTLARKNGEPRLLGCGEYGRVFAGRLHYDAAGAMKVKRVAVKVFHDDRKLNAEAAGNYNQVAAELIAAGEQLPRTRVLRLPREGSESFKGIAKPGEWIQVSELYGSTGKGTKFVGSTLASKSGPDYVSAIDFWRDRFPTPKTRVNAVRTLTRFASRGHSPMLDAIQPLKGREYVLPMDLDLLAETRPELIAVSLKTRDFFNARDLADAVNVLSGAGRERRRLRSVALSEATPAFRETLRKAFKKMN